MSNPPKKCPAGLPLWLATFADLMSLLLVLFVLLLTFAEMNVVRYKALAGSMRDAFGLVKEDRLSGVIEIDGSIKRKTAAEVDPTTSPIPVVSIDLTNEEVQEEDFEMDQTAPQEKQVEQVQDAVTKVLKDSDTGVEVKRTGDEVVITFPSSIAFPSGTDAVNQHFAATIDSLAPILKKSEGQIIVAGHTDNVPITSGRFRSNWDLSAARATAVVHRLIEYGGLNPGRMTVQGYGESRPLVANDSPTNRAKNRRVEVTVVIRKKMGEGDGGNAPEPKKEDGDGNSSSQSLPGLDEAIGRGNGVSIPLN